MQFDARAAKLLTAGQHCTITECPGLRLEATTTTRKWVYRYKSPVDGKMRQVKIGEWPSLSVSAAVAAWERLRADRAGGVDAAALKKQALADTRAAAAIERAAASADRLTVRRLCGFYLAGRVEGHRKEKGAAEVRRVFDTMLGEFGDLTPDQVTRAAAFNLLESYLHIPVQAAKLRAELGGAWDYGLDSGRLSDSVPNWWRLIMRGRLRSKGRKVGGESIGTGKRVLSADEIGILIRWLPNFTRLIEDALTLYLWTCARGGEILMMERREISEEPDGMWWTLPKAKTKNARHEGATDFRVPLVGRAAAIVRRRLETETGSYLFPSSGALGYVEQKVVGVAVWTRRQTCTSRPELKRSRLPMADWTPHDLRRSSRTLLAALGCPEEVGEALLGHMKGGIVGVYNRHSYDKERRIWLARLSDHLEVLAAS
ncbi:site-specific integrase [Massilia sp. R2A-15]|uniref:tyrosine-type recombinase/integrase n=1 Tax=Massilia sp. R2A-15 TaxID=3064278 RepID=UPI002733E6E4|nr:site-specific integrase [Massilia sp. R2A-15]WLI87851.1 site-specific integrase [Massilia sp. R2A-15]